MSPNEIQITKRDGRKEPLELDKLHKVVFHACEGITGVSESEVEIKSHIQFYTGITSAEIQETLIKSAADLITEETPNYQFVAGRLINYHFDFCLNHESQCSQFYFLHLHHRISLHQTDFLI